MALLSGVLAKALISSTELPGKNWKITPKSNTKDVSNTRDGRKRIAGLVDAEASLTIEVDGAAFPFDNPPNLIHGASVTLKLYVTATRFWTGTFLVDEVTHSSEIDGVQEYEIKVVLETGSTLVYP